MFLMMRTPDPLRRLLLPRHRLVIPPPARDARLVVLGAAAGRVALLDVLDAVGSEGVREYVFCDAVSGACFSVRCFL